ncbi:hypothetical protein pb186bvf_008518 [Paramecium bursaria]
MQNKYKLGHLIKGEDQESYGINNQILLYSNQQPNILGVEKIAENGALDNRFCDVNDAFKNLLCLFTNITSVTKEQLLQQLERDQLYIYDNESTFLNVNEGQIQSELQAVQKGKIEIIEDVALQKLMNMIKLANQNYKDQLDQYGKIICFKHPKPILMSFILQQSNQQFENVHLTLNDKSTSFEFIGYFQKQVEPYKIIQQYIDHIIMQLKQNKDLSQYYFQDGQVLPLQNQGGQKCRRFYYQQYKFQYGYNKDGKILNIHHYLTPKQIDNSQRFLCKGDYYYFHYMQDNFDDNGWGCAYRSFQTILSWLIENEHCRTIPIPTHKQIQQTLIEMKDKPVEFLGSSEWIGAFEVSMLITQLTGIECKIINIKKGSQVIEHLNTFKNHFIQNGCPIMFGGGLYAYTLLGVEFSDVERRFLILDPHYTGEDKIKQILLKQGVSWKKEDLFEDKNFYNFCIPLI